MFRTGSGKTVEMKRSSFVKALSVIGENDVGDTGESFALRQFNRFYVIKYLFSYICLSGV